MIKKIDWLTYASLMALALGCYTSMTFSALAHIFILVPVIYFLPKTNFKILSKSQWSLLALIVAMFASIIFNQDIAVKGFTPIPKLKYYLISLLSIVPIQHWYDQLSADERKKKIKLLIHAVFATSVFASLYGLGRIFFGINLFHLKFSDATRNTGLFGMVLNFAHDLAFIEIVAMYFIFNRSKTRQFIGTPFLLACLIINFVSLYYTTSRGAIVAFFVAIPFVFFFKNIKYFLIVTLVAIGIFLAGYSSRYKIARPGSDSERMSQWQTAYVGFKERPILGLGYLNFEQRCPEIKERNNLPVKNFCGHAHNNFLEVLADTGIIGFVCFLSWVFFWGLELIKRKDLISEITIPLIVVFLVGGVTQSTFVLGANLFIIMGIYTISMIEEKKVNV